MSDTNAIDVNELDSVISEAAEAEAIEVKPDVETEPGISTAKQLEPLLGMTFKMLAPNWRVQPEEVEVLAESYGSCIDYYYPEIQEGLPPWLTPLIVTAAIVGPRLNIPRNVEEKPVNGETVNDGKG